MSSFANRTLIAFVSMVGTASAAMVKPVGTDATSYLERDGEYHEADHLTDGKADKAWIEGADGSGLGSSFTIDLGALTRVSSLKIWNGYWITPTYWGRYNRAKEIEVQVGDAGTVHKFTLKDEMKPEVVRFPSPVDTSTIRVKIKGIYKGNTYNDTAFSEVQVMDTGPLSFVQPASYTSSTSLGPEYGTDGLADGIKDTMWCEGSESDGTGEWIEFDFGGGQTISKLRFNNGVGSGMSDFFNANHATSIKLDFSDGSSWTGTPKSSLIQQTLSFPARRTSKVKMTFAAVKKGKKYNDLCVSEAVFMP